MFEYLERYVGVKKPPNRFWTVEQHEIESAEVCLGFSFPEQLFGFYSEIGSGFLSQGVEDKERDPSLINGILSPGEVEDVLLENDNPARPLEGFTTNAIPFFDAGENTYLVLLPHSEKPNRVYWPDGKQVVSESLDEFFRSLYHRAGFYRSE